MIPSKYNVDICPDAPVDTAPKAELQVKQLIAVQFQSGTYTIVIHIYVFRSIYIIPSSLTLNHKFFNTQDQGLHWDLYSTLSGHTYSN